MATETDGDCLICQDSWKDVTSALPCHHRFCLGCILRWAHRNPSCPLCRTPIETIRLSEHADEHLDTASTAPEQLPAATGQAGRAPDHLDENSPHGPVASSPAAPQGTLSPAEQGLSGPEFPGGLLPEVWAGLFRGGPQLLEPVQPWLHRRLEGIFRRWWWLVEAAESSILHDLCVKGLNAKALVQGLQSVLEQHTAPLVHGIISIIVGQCSEEAQRLLHFGAIRDENNGPVATASSSSSSYQTSSSWMRAAAHGPKVFGVEEEAGTLEAAFPGGPSHPPPVPVPMEWDWPQEEPQKEVVRVAQIPLPRAADSAPPPLSWSGTNCHGTPCTPLREGSPAPRTLPSPARGQPTGNSSRALTNLH